MKAVVAFFSVIDTAKKKKKKKRFPSEWPLKFCRGLRCPKWEITIPLHVGHFGPRAAEASSLQYKSEKLGRPIWDVRSPNERKQSADRRAGRAPTFCTFRSPLSPSVGDLQPRNRAVCSRRWSDWNENHHLNVWGHGDGGGRRWEEAGIKSEGRRRRRRLGSRTKNGLLECGAAINGKPSAQLNKSTDHWQYTSLRRVEFCNNACLSIIAIFHPRGN